jgi:hypothetical protein
METENLTNLPLATIMERVVARDAKATIEFDRRARPQIRRLVHSFLGEAGFRVDRDLIDDIVGDAFVHLLEHAHAWRADGGAAPWTWAKLRIRAIAFKHLGIVGEQFDEESGDGSDEGSDEGFDPSTELDDPADATVGAPVPLEVNLPAAERPELLLAALTAEHPRLGRFLELLSRSASERDQRIYLRMIEELELGNGAWSETVAVEESMNPPAARQAASRTARRMRALAATEEFADIADLRAIAS